MGQKLNNIPVTMDDEFVSEIDRTAAEMKESRSFVMRSAIRYGLPLVRSKGGADVVQLDGELSLEVGRVAAQHDLPRQKVLIEAVRAGLRAAHMRWVADAAAQSQTGGEIDTPELVAAVLQSGGDILAHDLVVTRSHESALRKFLACIESDPEGRKVVSRIREQLKKAVDRNNLSEKAPGEPDESAPKQSKPKDKGRDRRAPESQD
jgi:hypothetical protein